MMTVQRLRAIIKRLMLALNPLTIAINTWMIGIRPQTVFVKTGKAAAFGALTRDRRLD